MPESSILVVLPPREHFTHEAAGAVALVVADQYRYSRLRPSIHILGGDHPGTPLCPGPYIPVGKPRWLWGRRNTHLARQAADYARQLNAGVIEIHNRPVMLKPLLQRHRSARILLYLHNDPHTMRGCATAAQRQATLDRCEAVACVSRFIRDRFLEGIRHGREKVHVVSLGMHLPTLAEGSAPRRKRIVYAGRMVPEKGVLPLAEALATVLPQHPEWDAAFIGAAGFGRSDASTPCERAVAQTLEPLGDRVLATNFLPHEQVLAYFTASEIAVVPARWQEPFGRTAMEALACGCALISSTAAGLDEVIGDAAERLDTVDRDTLAAALERVIRDDAHRADLQQRGRRRAEAMFEVHQTVARMDDLRETIMQA